MLSSEEIERFALEGYVIKRGVVPLDKVAAAVDVVWEHLPHMRRDDPASWDAPVHDCRGNMGMSERFGLVKLRKEVGQEQRVGEVTAQEPAIRAMAKQLLGPDRMAPPRGFRGLYPIFPTPGHAEVPPNGHVDETPRTFRFGVGIYLSEIGPGEGGLLVWPGSHRSLHFASATTGCTYADFATESFLRAYHAWNRTEPVEVLAGPGDVVLFHNRLLHCPSVNRNAAKVRLAAYFNIMPADSRTGPTGALWEGWDGIRGIGSSQVAATEHTSLEGPSEAQWSERRRGLPTGGAHASFAKELAKAIRHSADMVAS